MRVILTHADGRPIEGDPGDPPGHDGGVETVVRWLRARAAYLDRCTDVANAAFAQGWRESLSHEENGKAGAG